jgi:glycerol-3-phosphate dehydrogenase
VTKDLPLHGVDDHAKAELVLRDALLGKPLVEGYPLRAVDVVWAARYQMARTVEDVLARRNRLLFLRARDAINAAPAVASILARELGREDAWIDEQLVQFRQLAKSYLPPRTIV